MCLWKTPKIKAPTATARDILPSTSSDTPNSPIFGGSDDWKRKTRGAQSLQIKRDDDTGYNSDYKKGSWSI